jgi:ferric-dicitrate binding protein FerR (iron transport regulator)/tetratricopeptide (TPR) repeat protein
MNSYGCEQFREELGDSLGDVLSPAAAEHLADCDDCRDLRHDARAAARAVTRAGADYLPPSPEELEAKILAALDARGAGATNVVPLPTIAKTAVMPAAPVASPELAPNTFPDVPAVMPPPAPPPVTHARPVPPPRRARTVFALVGAVAAAALAVVALRPGDRPAVPGSPSTAAPNAHANTAWEGTVSQVLRASAERGEGMSLQRPGSSAWEPVSARGSVPAGSALRTDARTRARVSLADGTVLVLDRATELRFDGRAPRTASLVAGNVVADVAHTDTTARLKTAAGDIEVLGTRFALTATADRTAVRVTRGAVRLRVEQGDVEVKAGQEGTVDTGAAPVVAPAVDLASSFAWSELGGAPNDTAERGAPGLGELRARRPGSTTERDQAVRLERHAVKVRIVGSVARTEIEEVFRNDTDQTLEGIYRFPLPPEAQVEDLALDVDGRMESGAFVERERAAAIWRGAIRNATAPAQRMREEFVWVPGPWHDPALLEWQRGGRFELRVFPIPARGARRVRIAYTQTVAASSGVRRYTYPLAHDPSGSTRVEQFDVDVQVLGNDPGRPVRATGYPLNGDARRMSFSQRGFVPAGDLSVEYTAAERGPVSAWAYDPNGTTAPGASPEDGYVAFALRPQLPRWNESRPRDYVLVVDASRSMTGERYTRATRLAGAVVAEMDRRDRFTVLACDTRCREMSGGMVPASAEGARETQRFLQGVEPNGATDLLAQLRAALRTRGAGEGDRDLRVVYVGDGVSTAGPRHPERLAAAVGAELAAHPGTLTTVAVGNDVETDTLQAVARVGGGAMVPYVPGESLGGAALGVLEATWGVTLREPEVVLPQGLAAIAPRVLPTLRAGGELRVVARMTAPSVRGEIILRGTVAGQRFESRHPVDLTATRDAGNAFVPRLYAAARVADLDREEGDAPKREAVALSQRFRVPSRHTSLLVLESPAMFRAFGLDRSTAAPAWDAETAAVPTLITGTAANEDETAAAEPSMDDLAANTRADAPAAAPAPSPSQAAGALGAGRAHRGHNAGAGYLGGLDRDEVSRESRARTAAVIVAPARRPPPMDRFPRDPRGGQWMQRVWVRRGTVRAARDGSVGDLPVSVVQGIESAREALRGNPDSRDRHRALYRWLSVAGDLDEATQVADRWIARDPMDIDALARKSDALARAGNRDEAVRTLEAMADARPEDVTVLERLATLHERGGDARLACAWRVSLAEVRPRDAQHLARALRCLRSTGDGALAQRMVDAVDVSVREPAERAAFETAPMDSSVRGDLQVSASWYGGEDLDIALIDPQGARISWQGGRAGVTASGATSPSRESLGVSRASTGEWLVEVVRADANDARGRITRGEVTVTVLGERRTFSFSLDGARTRVARAAVIRESRLVPADHAPPPGSRIVL